MRGPFLKLFLAASGLGVVTQIQACATPAASKVGVNESEVKPVAAHPDLSGYTSTFKELPLVASLSRLPWPSDNWSSAHGGTSFRWQMAVKADSDELEDLAPFIHYPLGQDEDRDALSPSEKLDLYLGNKGWDLTKKERARTLGQRKADGSPRPEAEIPEWEGIQHAWSIAALQFQPVGPVTVKDKDGKPLTFESQDIYSLVSLFVHEQRPPAVVLASLCEKQAGMDKQELAAATGPYVFENNKQAIRRKGCEKIDPATFHLVLANQIGKLNEGFIIDRDHQGEISNNPVLAYESRIVNEGPTQATTANKLRKVHLRTILFLTSETPVIHLDEEDLTYPYDRENYEYTLDIDADGKIVSGQWIDSKKGEANASIPDFMWKAKAVWLNGPIRTIYEQGQQNYASEKAHQLRPLEDMPQSDRKVLNSYFSDSPASAAPNVQ